MECIQKFGGKTSAKFQVARIALKRNLRGCKDRTWMGLTQDHVQ